MMNQLRSKFTQTVGSLHVMLPCDVQGSCHVRRPAHLSLINTIKGSRCIQHLSKTTTRTTTPQQAHQPQDDVRLMSCGVSKTDKLKQSIKEHTQFSRQHMTPEIGLHLVTPETPLWDKPLSSDETKVLGDDPYWAFYWPGGQVMTRYLLDNPSLIRGKTVLDIGSGCGATAIAASVSGAHVVANDICTVSEVAMKMNGESNNVNIMCNRANLIGQELPGCDVILLGDMFYDEAIVNRLSTWMDTIHSQGTAVYIGDPGRLTLLNHPLRNQLKQLKVYDLPSNVHMLTNGLTQGYVWQYSPRS